MAFRASAGSTSGATTNAATFPTSQKGDYALAVVSIDDVSSNITPPAGWVQIDTQNLTVADGQKVAIFELTGGAPSSPPATYTWTFSIAANSSILIGTWSGRSLGRTFTQKTVTDSSNASPATFSLTGGTPLAGDDLVVAIGPDLSTSTSPTYSTITGFNAAVSQHFSFADVAFSTKDNVTGAATGNLSQTVTAASTNIGNVGWVIALSAPSSGPYLQSKPSPRALTRSFGFPGASQLPGMPALGAGLLVATTSPPAPITLSISGAASRELHGAFSVVVSPIEAGFLAQPQPRSFLRYPANVPAPQALSLGAGLLVAAPAGTPTVTLLMSGAQSNEVRGAPTLLTTLQPAGAASGERRGAFQQAFTLTPSGRSSDERHGAGTASFGVAVSGARSAETHGAPTLATTLAPAGGRSAEAHGASQITNALTLNPSGGSSGERHGAATLLVTLTPSGAASSERHGAPIVGQLLTLSPAGAASREAHGAVTLLFTLAPSGGASGARAGAATLVRTLGPSGARSGESHGAASWATVLTPAGASSRAASGAPVLSAVLAATGARSQERHGAAQVGNFLTLAGVGAASQERHGAFTLSVLLQPSGASSAERHGAFSSGAGITLSVSGAASQERHGAFVTAFGQVMLAHENRLSISIETATNTVSFSLTEARTVSFKA